MKPVLFDPRIPREEALRQGLEAVEICERGFYTDQSGQKHDLRAELDRSVSGTISYPPERTLPGDRAGEVVTQLDVSNETTLLAGWRMLQAGLNPVLLNFASATSAGGGFLNGSRAQEEYLARSSCLYESLRDNPMYGFHGRQDDPLYSNYVIYSPGVPVFRGDDGNLLAEPWTVSMLTSPAVHAYQVRAERRDRIAPAMWERILKVLSAGLEHGHDGIVLGAWGCGAFGCDGKEIAGLFARALGENFRGAYRRVSFAIIDRSPDERFIGPFRDALLPR